MIRAGKDGQFSHKISRPTELFNKSIRQKNKNMNSQIKNEGCLVKIC